MTTKIVKLKTVQNEIIQWSERNFGDEPNEAIPLRISSFLGMVEELGEIAHAVLKWTQGIRGTQEEHKLAVEDGVADLLVFTLDFCARNGMDAEELLEAVWAKIKQRDWVKNNQTGDVDGSKQA